MLRSGYYAPDHPAGKTAKEGLYAEFRKILGQEHELMFTDEESLGLADISITGINDEPVSVQRLVGHGQADLFLPKLHEYFQRKDLVSLALKKSLPEQHFLKFIEIMHSQEGGSSEDQDDEMGATMTRALAEAGISAVSTVFRNDMLELAKHLPWRVQVAINRLFKDIKVLPLFKGKSEAEIKAMKVQIVQDILRPLKQPYLLADLITNCYLIALDIESLDEQELERTIITFFPLSMLLDTSRHVMEALQRLRDTLKGSDAAPDARLLKQQISSVKRVLKLLAQRMTHEKTPGYEIVIEELHLNGILTFKELPPAVQYRVNSQRMAKDIVNNSRAYGVRLRQAANSSEASMLLRCFRRVAPILVENESWPALLELTHAAATVAPERLAETPVRSNVPFSIFKGLEDDLLTKFIETDVAKRATLAAIMELLGEQGAMLLLKILRKGEDKGVRHDATTALTAIGPSARSVLITILDDPKQDWFMIRNALYVLGQVGIQEEDIGRVGKFLRHTNSKIRKTALEAAINLRPGDLETILVRAIRDQDPNVRRLAVTSLRDISPLSRESMATLLATITSPVPED